MSTLPQEDRYHLLPIHVITGFLGSGKTTLLNRLLGQPGMEHTAVIVNEFGTVGIDHLLVQSSTEDILMLEGGCVCCTVRTDLVTTLEDLYQRRSTGEIPPFTQVVLETTGLADPAPILRTLLNDAFVAEHYRLDAVVTTVDCLHAEAQFAEYDESVKQAALAHHLVLTKTDLAKPPAVAQLRQRLDRMNPGATLYEAQHDALEARRLFDSGAYREQSLDVENWLQVGIYRQVQQQTALITENAPPHDKYIQTFCIERDTPLSWQVLDRWFKQLTRLRGKDLLRVKGIAYTCETELPVLVQGVQHVFQAPSTLANWPSQPPRTQIVFITRNIPRQVVEDNLRALELSDSPQDVCAAAMILL